MRTRSNSNFRRGIAIAVASLLAMVVTGECNAAEPARVSSYRWSCAVDQPDIDRPTLEAIALDSPIYGGSEANLADLRLVDGGGEPVAFVLRPTPSRMAGGAKVSYPAVGFHVSEDPQRKQTLLEFETDGEPLTGLTLLTSQTNFSRAVTLEILAPHTGPRDRRIVNTQQISRFAVESVRKDELSMTFPERRAKHYRLVVQNGDSAPIDFTGVDLTGPQYQIVLLASPGERFNVVRMMRPKYAYQIVLLASPGERLRLEYGSAGARQADYDTAAIERALAGGIEPETIHLGDPEQNHQAPTPPLTFTWLLGHGRVVAPVLGVLTILLGWLLYRASQRIDPDQPT